MARVSKSIKNITSSFVWYFLKILVQFVSRSIFIQILGREYLGLSGLFSNILNVLALVELGFGQAICFCLYAPLSRDDINEIKPLMQLFRKVYLIVAGVVLVAGLSLTPFLHFFINGLPDIPHLQWIYVLYVLNTAISYLCIYKQTLIIADQKQYIVSRYVYGGTIVMTIVQTLLLVWTHDYFLYLYVMIAFTLIQNLLISHRADKMYPYLREPCKEKVPARASNIIKRNIRAMVYQKIGHVLVNSTDNILMAKLVDLGTVGLYSNYSMISVTLSTATGLVYNGISASVGNMGAVETDEVKTQIFKRIDFFSHWLFGFCTVCLVCLFSPFISLWLGDSYRFPITTEMLICVNFMIMGFRQPVLTTKNALGLYWVDRHKSLAAAAINLIVSIVLGRKMGVAGILIGTLVTSVLTDLWIEPLVLFRMGFHTGVGGYFLHYAFSVVLTALNTALTYFLCSQLPWSIWGFIGKAAICVVVPNLIYTIVYWRREEFEYFRELAWSIIMEHRRK